MERAMRAMSLLLGFAIVIFVTVGLTKLGKDSVKQPQNIKKEVLSEKAEKKKQASTPEDKQ